MIRLELLESGRSREVFALVVNERCETYEFLAGLKEKPRRKVEAVLKRLSDIGRAGHEEHIVKRLEDNVFEIKENTTTSRLFFFEWKQQIVVCTHAARKPAGNKRYQIEIDRVKRLMNQCLEENKLP